jgi:hypothetical protein
LRLPECISGTNKRSFGNEVENEEFFLDGDTPGRPGHGGNGQRGADYGQKYPHGYYTPTS